jgi:hypothetical protein
MRPFGEASMKLEDVGDNLNKLGRKRYKAVCFTDTANGQTEEKELFSFEDICTKCESVILNYIERIKLESQDEEERPKRRSRTEKVEAEKVIPEVSTSDAVSEVVEKKVEALSSNGVGIEVSVVSEQSQPSHLF